MFNLSRCRKCPYVNECETGFRPGEKPRDLAEAGNRVWGQRNRILQDVVGTCKEAIPEDVKGEERYFMCAERVGQITAQREMQLAESQEAKVVQLFPPMKKPES